MRTFQKTSLRMPISLLLDPDLPASAKVLWGVIRFIMEEEAGPDVDAKGDSLDNLELAASRGYRLGTLPLRRRQRRKSLSLRSLAARSGMSPNSVRRGLDELVAKGWVKKIALSPYKPESFRAVVLEPLKWTSPALPADLLLDPGIRPQAKLIYGYLQLIPGFRQSQGKFSKRQLAELTGVGHAALTSGLRTLAEGGWIEISRKNRVRPISFRLRNPAAERRKELVRSVQDRLQRAEYRGQQIMAEFLSMLIPSLDYIDNSRPGFLLNPYTQESMEYDRYYFKARVAFEFNGPQHYQPTEQFPSQKELLRQQARDHMKRGISELKGVKLITVRADDLTLEGMLFKVMEAGGRLPLRPLQGLGLLINYLESLGRAYRRAIHRAEERRADERRASGELSR